MTKKKIKINIDKPTIYYCLECGNTSTVNYKCCELCGCDKWEEDKAGDNNG